MAVFPERIILKHSTDSESSISTQIASGGPESVLPGELVIGRENGAIKLYAIDSAGVVRTIASVDLSSTSLDALGDVDTSTVAPVVGQSLVWDGTNWVPNRPIDSINDLSDVDTSTPVIVGKVLAWDGTNWVPTTPVSSIDALTDVDTNTVAPIIGQSLVWDGNNWIPDTPVASFNDLTDVDTLTNPPLPNQTISWDGTNWVPKTIDTDFSIGRGDGGNFDLSISLASFVFGVYGGGDFDATTNDVPVEYFDSSIIDAGEIT